MVVQWSDAKHALGIPEVDRQHQQLFLITNQLWQAQDLPGSPERKNRMVAGLKRLYAYCHYHFNDEEQLLTTRGYPGMVAHRQIHRDFTAQVKVYLLDTRDSPHPDLSVILDSLVQWILDHIMGDDRTWANLLTSQGHRWEPDTVREANVLDLWKDQALALELEGIDDQHKELISILQQANDLLRAVPARQRLFLPNVIRKLFYYSQFHFSFEEELMSRHAWSGLAAHRVLHQGFIQRLLQFSDEYKRHKATLSEELVLFLKDWTLKHILTEDRQFKDYLMH